MHIDIVDIHPRSHENKLLFRARFFRDTFEQTGKDLLSNLEDPLIIKLYVSVCVN